MKRKACVIGSGPNGLAAAIVLAQAGLEVDVFEAEATVGGGARTLEVTLPGFHHDFGSAVHPMAAGSPFFTSLPLEDYGLQWIHSPAPLAHPLDDGTAVVLERELGDAEAALGEDGNSWRRLMQPFAECWSDFAQDVLRPMPSIPKHLALMARFGLHALSSAKAIADGHFRSERTRALFAGLAGHSFLALDEVLSGALGLMFAISTHAVGWPIARGGSQAIANALCGYLASLGGRVKTSARVETISDVADRDLILCDLTPKQILEVAGERLAEPYKRSLQRYRYGAAAFKVDYALHAPIPWKAKDCLRAATVHLGGTFEEIAAAEHAARTGHIPEHPFVLLSQPTLFDPSRAPDGKHIVWAYCHVPNASIFDMLPRLENQIERFAPGFRDCILERQVFRPSDLEKMDANLIGGDIAGGVLDIRQFLFRPTRRHYATSDPRIYICSSSTPPGAGVHGMCGFHAAKMALSRIRA